MSNKSFLGHWYHSENLETREPGKISPVVILHEHLERLSTELEVGGLGRVCKVHGLHLRGGGDQEQNSLPGE